MMDAINRAATVVNEPSVDLGYIAIYAWDMTVNITQPFQADGVDSHRETLPTKVHSSNIGLFFCMLIKAFKAEAN